MKLTIVIFLKQWKRQTVKVMHTICRINYNYIVKSYFESCDGHFNNPALVINLTHWQYISCCKSKTSRSTDNLNQLFTKLYHPQDLVWMKFPMETPKVFNVYFYLCSTRHIGYCTQYVCRNRNNKVLYTINKRKQ